MTSADMKHTAIIQNLNTQLCSCQKPQQKELPSKCGGYLNLYDFSFILTFGQQYKISNRDLDILPTLSILF